MKDYSQKPRCYMLMQDINFFGQTIKMGTVYYFIKDLDNAIPVFITKDNIPIMDMVKTLRFENIINNKEYFCEIPLIKEYLKVLNKFFRINK